MPRKKFWSAFVLLVPMLSSATTLGLHVASRHDAPGFNNANTGVYVLFDNGLTAGTFNNSDSRQSVYAGMTWAKPLTGRVDAAVTAGLITGYWKGPAPLLVPSVSYALTSGVKLRAALLLKVEKSGANALHLMVEKNFN